MASKNKTTVVAEPGKQELFITQGIRGSQKPCV